MTSMRKLEANRQNALKSTGPRTVSGKATSSRNATKSGVYARLAVLTAFGETPEDFEAFTRLITRRLGAIGSVERSIAQHVAGLFWRQRRMMAVEAIALTQNIHDLPPDPDTITADLARPIPYRPTSPTLTTQLANTRQSLNGSRRSCDVVEDAIEAVNPNNSMDFLLKRESGHYIFCEAAFVLGHGNNSPQMSRWDPIITELGASPSQSEWTIGLIRGAVEMLAEKSNRNADDVWAKTMAAVVASAIPLRARRAELEREEAALVKKITTERERLVAAALVADSKRSDAIARSESHLSRELQRALAMLDSVQTKRMKHSDSHKCVFEKSSLALEESLTSSEPALGSVS